MEAVNSRTDLGIADRIRRSAGRGGRVISANAKVTKQEHRELEAAATRDGKALGEWAREALLEKARSGANSAAVFTELVALRLLATMVLRPIALGEKVSPEAYAQYLAQVRRDKHEAAREMLSQYQTKGE